MAIEDIGINITKEVIVAIFAMMKKPIVTVIALNKHKVPVKGVIVTLNDRSEKTVGSGKAIFEGLTAGKHILSVKYGEKEEPELEIIYLEAGEKATITLTLPDSLFESIPTSGPEIKNTETPKIVPIVEGPPSVPQPDTVNVVVVPPIDPFELFITELATFVHINANGDIDMTEPQKAKDTILKTPQNLGAAFLVVQSLDEIKRDLLKQLHTNIDNQLKARSYHLIWDEDLAIRHAGFSILFDDRQDKFLSFAFDSTGFRNFFLGIKPKDQDIIISNEAKNEISAIMEKMFRRTCGEWWWPWWIWAHYAGLNGDRNWSTNPAPWQAMQDGTLANKIVGIADKVHAAFKDRMDLLMPTS